MISSPKMHSLWFVPQGALPWNTRLGAHFQGAHSSWCALFV